MTPDSTFRKNDNILDGFAAAIRNGELVWVGPIQLCPLDRFEPGTDIFVNSALYDRIERAVQQVEEGVPYDQQPSSGTGRQDGDQSGET